MKKEDWEKAKSRLRAPLGQVDLLCDGYSVTLVNECISMFRNGIAVYVNGEIRGSWFVQDCEERRRFIPQKETSLMTRKQIAAYNKMPKKDGGHLKSSARKPSRPIRHTGRTGRRLSSILKPTMPTSALSRRNKAKEYISMARKKVTSVPALADWGAVDNALRDIRECQHTLAEMAVQRDRQIDSIKADYAQGALPLQNRVKALESEVKAYVDLHRAELDGKSRALNFGTVGYRVSSKLMLASSRVAEAIATLKVLGHTELIKTTETLDREALKRQPGDILQQVGAYIRTVDEFYYDVSSKEADA